MSFTQTNRHSDKARRPDYLLATIMTQVMMSSHSMRQRSTGHNFEISQHKKSRKNFKFCILINHRVFLANSIDEN